MEDTEAEPEIWYFTDPLCSWSWAMEPQWRRLREEWGAHFRYRYFMGGMLPDWSTYRDPLNSINSPAQMGPAWFYVRSVTGVSLDERLWIEDPPQSSYPACIAVKAAERQGSAAGEAYLRRLREAAMTERRNIARPEVLLEAAAEVAAAAPFDGDRFEEDLTGPEAAQAFREDLKEARYRQIGRFPTLIFRPASGRGVLLTGYRPYETLHRALGQVASGREPFGNLQQQLPT